MGGGGGVGVTVVCFGFLNGRGGGVWYQKFIIQIQNLLIYEISYELRNENLAFESSAKKMKIPINAKTSTRGPMDTIYQANFSDVSEFLIAVFSTYSTTECLCWIQWDLSVEG